MEIEIPANLVEELLNYAYETDNPVEAVVERALQSFLERNSDYG